MWPTSVLVFVFIHLQASDTRREGVDEAWVQEQNKMTSSPILTYSTNKPLAAHNNQRGISREDEDLLDLMVRIAESPAEWDRIHRVLNQLGAEENTNGMETVEPARRINGSNILKKYNNTHINITAELSVVGITNENQTVSLVTPSNIGTKVKTHTNTFKGVTDKYETIETDTGWPDFAEAILKKVERNKKEIEDNRILESSWLQNSWLDTSWDKYSHKEIENSSKGSENLPETNMIPPIVSFKPVTTKKENSSPVEPIMSQSRLFQDPKILEFPLKEPVSVKNISSSDLTNRTARPVFLYHRVTTSPQERKNGAFIAVSVVKQTSLEPPSTDTPQAQIESWNTFANRKQEKQKSLGHNGRRPHSNTQGHHHRRGHRHHHTEPHSNL